MSSKSLLLLLQRCFAVRQVTFSTGIRTRVGLLSGRCGFIQQRSWASAARTVCVQRLLQSTVTTSRSSLCTKAGEPCEDEYPPLPTYQSDSEPEEKEVFILHVKGLPWSCSAEDLLHFFSDCRIRDGVKGIHLSVDRSGRPSGRAFIEMEHKEDVSKALEKHRQYLGPRYVEVYEVTDTYAEAILKKSVQSPDGVVRLRGLPFTCTEADIVHFFSGLDIAENGITIVTDYNGRHTGNAFVQFSSQKAADEALQRDREVIGNRYIEVFPSRSDEIHSQKRIRSNPGTRSPQNSALMLHRVHIRGLPFKVSGEDIVTFFSPLVVSKIQIEYGPNGRPNGEADVYFRCHQDTVAAMSRNKQYIGDRYIELFMNSAPESEGW
uniref:G-rich sequence factor 1 n=1 Tax=Scatophagus argus TaxID=75038 RepID=UPI001ED7F48E|nr:G-rich sequence factor 1 [Scatophagus argus]